jgi:hypothetical protein
LNRKPIPLSRKNYPRNPIPALSINLGSYQKRIDKKADIRATVVGDRIFSGAVRELVGIEGGVVSGVINLESPGVGALGGRPRHDQHYHEA